MDTEDYEFFLSLMNRHLCSAPSKDKNGRTYPHFRPQVSLLAYCLMPNHYHFLFFQKENPEALSKLMASIATAYTMYFNRKYKRRGPLFENRFKASAIYSDAYLQHITRYIHLNPSKFKSWPYSSYADYLNPTACPDWLDPLPILDLFDSQKQYTQFVQDYEGLHRELDTLKHELANY